MLTMIISLGPFIQKLYLNQRPGTSGKIEIIIEITFSQFIGPIGPTTSLDAFEGFVLSSFIDLIAMELAEY